jgi:hypothetical protein
MSDSDSEFYARLKIDLNTCYEITWASTVTEEIKTNSDGEPVDASGKVLPPGNEDYIYVDVTGPANSTSPMSMAFNTVFRSAMRDIFWKIQDK